MNLLRIFRKPKPTRERVVFMPRARSASQAAVARRREETTSKLRRIVAERQLVDAVNRAINP